jgi:hypothetical protein
MYLPAQKFQKRLLPKGLQFIATIENYLHIALLYMLIVKRKQKYEFGRSIEFQTFST